VAGEPSSIINQVQGGDTLRRNFQQIQVRHWPNLIFLNFFSHN
jgi:hypothetical protein